MTRRVYAQNQTRSRGNGRITNHSVSDRSRGSPGGWIQDMSQTSNASKRKTINLAPATDDAVAIEEEDNERKVKIGEGDGLLQACVFDSRWQGIRHLYHTLSRQAA